MKIKKFDNFINENEQTGGNKFILARVGINTMPAVSAFLIRVAKIKNSIATKVPGIILSMFETHLTKEALIQGLDGIDGIQYSLYQIVHVSGNTTGPSRVEREETVASMKLKLKKALDDQNFELAAQLRDKIDAKEGRPAHVIGNTSAPTTESKLYSFDKFELLHESEVSENFDITNEEFNKLISQLVDYELSKDKLENSDITKEMIQKIKDYLITKNIYVLPEGKERQ